MFDKGILMGIVVGIAASIFGNIAVISHFRWKDKETGGGQGLTGTTVEVDKDNFWVSIGGLCIWALIFIVLILLP